MTTKTPDAELRQNSDEMSRGAFTVMLAFLFVVPVVAMTLLCYLSTPWWKPLIGGLMAAVMLKLVREITKRL